MERSDFLCRVRPGRRHGAWIWLDPADGPELQDGDKGWYESSASATPRLAPASGR